MADRLKGHLSVWVGVVWCYFVVGAYLYFNSPYYVGKVAKFGDFILRSIK